MNAQAKPIAARASRLDATRPELTLWEVLDRQLLRPVYQPIAALNDGTIFAFEALIRGPIDSMLATPGELHAAAARERLAVEFELACLRTQLLAFHTLGLDGALFVNIGASALIEGHGRMLPALFDESGISPRRIVIELTERDAIDDPQAVAQALAGLRARGMRLALDDIGNGHSSLRLWIELQPEIVKIDRFFIDGIHADHRKLEVVRLLCNYGAKLGTQLVAEGIEDIADLAVVRDLGIPCAQGFLIGPPQPLPAQSLDLSAMATMRASRIEAYPEAVRASLRPVTAALLVTEAPAVPRSCSNDAIALLFDQHPELPAVAVVDGERPVGLINRRSFMDRYAKPFHRELYGRRGCGAFMNSRPVIIDRHTPLESLTHVLTSSDPSFLTDGFIVTDGDRYLGLGRGHDLVRAVTELRVESARYANPLTFLPGNLLINAHIGRLLGAGRSFVACYFDLNHFKPYNDQYGYRRGDEMIKLAAQVIAAECNAAGDFVGHVGGDDFIMLSLGDDWFGCCERIIARFDREALQLFDAEDRLRGALHCEDRAGNPAQFPLTTISAGAVPVRPGAFETQEHVALAATAAKRQAKQRRIGLHVLEADEIPPFGRRSSDLRPALA